MEILLNFLGPILVVIVGGWFGVHQHRIKTKLENENANCKTSNETMRKLVTDVDNLTKLFIESDERTKRIEIALMIYTRPTDHRTIQKLIEEYEGNHYVYDIATKWARDQDISLNPNKITKKMDY